MALLHKARIASTLPGRGQAGQALPPCSHEVVIPRPDELPQNGLKPSVDAYSSQYIRGALQRLEGDVNRRVAVRWRVRVPTDAIFRRKTLPLEWQRHNMPSRQNEDVVSSRVYDSAASRELDQRIVGVEHIRRHHGETESVTPPVSLSLFRRSTDFVRLRCVKRFPARVSPDMYQRTTPNGRIRPVRISGSSATPVDHHWRPFESCPIIPTHADPRVEFRQSPVVHVGGIHFASGCLLDHLASSTTSTPLYLWVSRPLGALPSRRDASSASVGAAARAD